MKAREKRRKRAARKANMPARLARAADALRRVYGFDEANHVLFTPDGTHALYKRLMDGVLANVGVSSGYWRTTSVLQDHPPAIQARIDELLATVRESQDRMASAPAMRTFLDLREAP
ncbi:hypothetical protein K0U83_17420 [bacterium]|nr:hypothetical protein [bacterium]